MNRFAIVLMVMLAGGVRSAAAQTPGAESAAEDHRFYGELVAAATFGHKSAASVGLEAGISVTDEWQVFIEGGRMSNVATADLDQRAQKIAGFIGSNGVSTAQRAVYFDIGARYQPPPFGTWHPYGLLGIGFASVKTSTAFGPSADVPPPLGNDLSSTLTKLFLTAGVGVTVPFGSRYLVDFSYRYGRIFPKTSQILDDPGINTQRLQAGIGVRF